MSEIIEVNDENFEQEVLQSDVPVLIDFNAVWCTPCRAMRPILQELALRLNDVHNDGILIGKVVKLDVNKNQDIAARFNVLAVPTFIVLKNAEEVSRLLGAQTIEKLTGEIMQCVSSTKLSD